MSVSSFIPNPSIASADPIDVLRLIRSENVGPMTFFHLVKFCGSVSKAIEMAPQMSARGGRKKPITISARADAEKELKALKSHGAELLLYGAPNYPSLLLQIPDAPPVLFTLGNTHLLEQNAIGIVGARNASTNGIQFARKMARDLGTAKYVTVSGLARGIDAAVHSASITTGTIAVIAGGINTIYPPEHESLYQDIAAAGVIVSEMPFGAQPLARSFPARNRIIAGISRGMVVIEASLKSGSLISANYAADYHRDVFSVPGSPLDPRAQGTNKLIKEGAILTESAADVLEHYRYAQRANPMGESDSHDFVSATTTMPSENELHSIRAMVLEKLSPTPTMIDELIEQCNTPAQHVLAVLLELELAGKIERLTGGRVAQLIEEDV